MIPHKRKATHSMRTNCTRTQRVHVSHRSFLVKIHVELSARADQKHSETSTTPKHDEYDWLTSLLQRIGNPLQLVNKRQHSFRRIRCDSLSFHYLSFVWIHLSADLRLAFSLMHEVQTEGGSNNWIMLTPRAPSHPQPSTTSM